MTRITELTPLLKRLQLGPMAATLPERIACEGRRENVPRGRPDCPVRAEENCTTRRLP